MSDFEYTDLLEDIDSTAVVDAYYNNYDKSMLVVLASSEDAYLYTGVPNYVWTAFKAADSKGSYYATFIKRNYGPAKALGNIWNLEFTEYGVPAPNMGQVLTPTFPLSAQPQTLGTPKGLTVATDAVVSNAVSASKVSVPVAEKFKHDVVFDVVGGASGKVVSFEETSVYAAKEEIARLADMLGLEIKVKSVTVHFE